MATDRARPTTRRRKVAKATDCGHGRVLNPCAIRLDPFIGCQACARMVMLDNGGIIMAAVPFEAVPLPGETITLHRVEIGDGAFTFVYRAPSTVSRHEPDTSAERDRQDDSGPSGADPSPLGASGPSWPGPVGR